MTKLLILTSAIALALSACSKQPAASQAASPALTAGKIAATDEDNHPLSRSADAPYYVKLPLAELMPHVMQYAGDGVWKRQGWISDRTGQHSLFPKNDAEWEDAESGARTLAEITNILLLPGRRVADPAWDKAVLRVRAVALKAAQAAEKKDKDAFFAAGGDLDEACDQCHIRFDPSFQKAT